MKLFSYLIILSALLLVPSQAGVITVYSLPADWTSAIGQSPTVLDLTAGTISTPTDVVVGDFTFNGENIILSGGIASSTGAITILIAPTTSIWGLAFNWTAPLTAGSQTAVITVTTANSGTFSVNADTLVNPTFWGVTATDTITSVSISADLTGGGTLALDTVQTADTPEPAAFWLLGAPLAILVRVKYKR